MKKEFKISINILIAILIYGFIAPYLISAKSNELVIIGVIIIATHIFYLVHLLIKHLKK